MEQEHLHDPLRFQYQSNTRTFSLRTKVIAVLLVLIFCIIPLYEISPETFKANYVYTALDCPKTLNCGGCFGTYPISLINLLF